MTPYVSSPSSVKVPVLSKHMMLILPAMLTLEGLMQKIEEDFRILIAKMIPTLIQVGKAGGTVMVMMSRLLLIMSETGTCCLIIM